MLYYTILYSTILYCTILYYTILGAHDDSGHGADLLRDDRRGVLRGVILLIITHYYVKS